MATDRFPDVVLQRAYVDGEQAAVDAYSKNFDRDARDAAMYAAMRAVLEAHDLKEQAGFNAALQDAVGLVASERNRWDGHDQRTSDHWAHVYTVLAARLLGEQP